jgi:hypothetical protein
MPNSRMKRLYTTASVGGVASGAQRRFAPPNAEEGPTNSVETRNSPSIWRGWVVERLPGRHGPQV